MREIEVTIEGLSPLLMHNIAAMNILQTAKKKIPTPEEEAAAGCYWLEDGSSLAVPSEAVHRSLVKAAGSYKSGKKSASGYVASLIHVSPALISLGTSKYVIDTRSAVVQRNRISRSRAKIDPWRLTFVMGFDDEWLDLAWMKDTMPEIIRSAGRLVGILDFRVEKKGPFGTFRLVRYELLPERKQKPLPEPEIVGFGAATRKKAA